MKSHCVYHISNDTDIEDGYVGVTRGLRRRLYQHRASGLFAERTVLRILLVGTEDDCLKLERQLRPEKGMGWNKAEGGWNHCTGTIGHEARIAAGERHSPATEFYKGQPAHNAGSTEYLLTDPNGNEYMVHNLTAFCKAKNLTRENLRKVARGTRKHHKGWTAALTGR